MSDRTTAARDDNWMAGGSFGDVVAEAYKEGHISDVHYVTACRLMHDMRRAHGSSAGIVCHPQERVQTSFRARTAPPGGGDPDAFDRMNRLLCKLREHERNFFTFLIVKRELPRGSFCDWGRQRTGYQTNKTTRAATMGMLVSLLDSVVELYG